MNYQQITQIVNKFFISVDKNEWETLKSIFAESVLLDYTSVIGGQPLVLTSIQIIDSWRGLLPGFDHTHHQIGNMLIDITEEKANVYCYVTASHYLVNETANNIWAVVGSYDLELEYKTTTWHITKMKFNRKYIDGNNELPNLAQERLKK